MALPTIQSSIKISKIGDKRLKIRAFTGNEEKALLLAKMQGDKSSLIQTLVDVLTSCSDYDVSTLTEGELERLFLDIRCISVSDTLEPNLICQKCQAPNPVKIPAAQIKNPEQFVVEIDVKAGEDEEKNAIFVKLRTPTIAKVMEASDKEDADMFVIFSSVTSIYDSKGNIYDSFEFDEFKEWFMGLSGVYVQALAFVRNSPKMSYAKEFQCVKCGEGQKFEIRGLHDFLH
ncbi:baseplate hub [Rhizobium phage RL2RES]|uniref:Baseplate hub subunit or baseplate hub assembly protein n=1 Tax=Rhizobium phage RL2RES TaxID=103371 RepID=A0A6B9J1Q9_9CAUD|nr:baseplate hub [Rhizobium phage RL2RES]QGZ14157.1 baseplate hub subunit or baseplate hub assembly protein [Rhizobium phage RL2RES]